MKNYIIGKTSVIFLPVIGIRVRSQEKPETRYGRAVTASIAEAGISSSMIASRGRLSLSPEARASAATHPASTIATTGRSLLRRGRGPEASSPRPVLIARIIRAAPASVTTTSTPHAKAMPAAFTGISTDSGASPKAA